MLAVKSSFSATANTSRASSARSSKTRFAIRRPAPLSRSSSRAPTTREDQCRGRKARASPQSAQPDLRALLPARRHRRVRQRSWPLARATASRADGRQDRSRLNPRTHHLFARAAPAPASEPAGARGARPRLTALPTAHPEQGRSHRPRPPPAVSPSVGNATATSAGISFGGSPRQAVRSRRRAFAAVC